MELGSKIYYFGIENLIKVFYKIGIGRSMLNDMEVFFDKYSLSTLLI